MKSLLASISVSLETITSDVLQCTIMLAILCDFEARKHIEQAIRIGEHFYGTANVFVADSLTVLGDIVQKQNQLDEALLIYERSLAIFRTTSHPGIRIVLNGIGMVYARQRKFDLALEKYRESLLICQSSFGENHMNTATMLQNVGNVLLKQGDFDGAIAHLQRALAIFEKVYLVVFSLSSFEWFKI